LKSTQKSPLTLPSISGLQTNWDKIRVSSGKDFSTRHTIQRASFAEIAPVGKTVTRFKAGDALLTFLASL
jgi:hypothetical protein